MPFTPIEETEVEPARFTPVHETQPTEEPGLEALHPEGALARIPAVAAGIANLASFFPRGAAATIGATATTPFLMRKSEITGQRPLLGETFKEAFDQLYDVGHVPYIGPKDIPVGGGEKIEPGAVPEHLLGKIFSGYQEEVHKGPGEKTFEAVEKVAPALAPAAGAGVEALYNAAAFALGGRAKAEAGRTGTGREVSTVVRPQEPPPGPSSIDQWLERRREARAGPIQDVGEVGGVEPGMELARPAVPDQVAAGMNEAAGRDLSAARDRAQAFTDRMQELRSRAEEAGRVQYEPRKNAEPVPFEVTPAMAAREKLQALEARGEAPEYGTPEHEVASALAEKSAKRIFSDHANAVAAYEALPESKGGTVFNPDIASEMVPAYVKNRELASSVHDSASDFVKKYYAERLARLTPEGKDPVVVFTAGGPGSGKSAAVQKALGKGNEELIYDSSLSRYDSSVERIDKALASGRQVKINFVDRDPARAYEHGVVSRVERGLRRIVPVKEHARSHTEAREVIHRLAEHYADNPNVAIRVVSNNGGLEDARVAPLGSVPHLKYNDVYEKVRETGERAVREGRISPAQFRFALEDASWSPESGSLPAERGSDRGASRQGASGAQPEVVSQVGVQAADLVRRDSKGRIIGGFGSRHLATVNAALKRMEKLAREGEAVRGWYSESAKAILDAVGGDKNAADRIAQVLAITSAGTEIKANFTMAARALEQYARGESIKVATGQKNKAVEDLLYHGIVPDSVKVDDFYRNLAQHITGETTDRPVTDRWQFRIASGDKEKHDGTAQQYEYATMLVAETAKRLGWKPDEAQAAMWVAMKAKAKLAAMKESVATSKGSKYAGMSNAELEKIALDTAKVSFASEIQARNWKPPEGAKFPTIEELKAAHQTLTAEVKPSTKTAIGKRSAEMSPKELEAFQKKALDVVGGADAFMRKMGLSPTAFTTHPGSGAYEGGTAPNMIASIRATKEVVDRVAKGWMYVFKQDAVPYFRASRALVNDASATRGIYITAADFTATQEKRFYEHLRREVDPGIGYTRDGNTFMVMNFHGQDVQQFLEKMDTALKSPDNPLKVESAVDYGAQSEYPYHDWEKDPEGKALLDQAGSGGSPDLQPWLRSRADAFQRFAEENLPGEEPRKVAVSGPRRKGSGIDQIAVSVDEPVGEVAKTLEKKFEPEAYLQRYQRNLVRAEKTTIAVAVKDLISAGMPEHFLDATNGFTASVTGSTKASYNTENRTVSVLRILDAEDTTLRGYVAHEMTHAVDHAPDKGAKPTLVQNFISATSPRLEVGQVPEEQFWKMIGKGDIAKEIIDRWEGGRRDAGLGMAGDRAIENFFDYPLAADFPSARLYSLEMFAQMGRLYLTNPELMREELPIAYSAMKEIYDNAGTSLEETRDAIRATLQTPGAPARAAVGVGRERGQGELFKAAQRSAGERGAGEGVVGVQATAKHGGRADRVDQTETQQPRIFYRGSEPGKTERIKTGNTSWDNLLFASSNRDSASYYGKNIETIHAKPEAKILYYGTKEFSSVSKGLSPQKMSLLDYSAEVADRAKAAGYDAVHFQRQGDVGTAILNPDKFTRNAADGTFDPSMLAVQAGGGGKKPPGAVVPHGGAPNPYWDVDQPGLRDNLTRAWQNNQIDLKKTQEAIERAAGTITEKGDAYLAEELYRDRVTSRVKRDYKNQVEPILKDIKDAGLTVDETSRYLWARHAPERNKAMEKINPGETDLSGLSDAEAKQILASFSPAKRAALDGIGTKIDALTASTRQILEREGLEDKTTLMAWERAYKHYVPLFRDLDETGTGSGFQVKGPESKRAMGSHREAQAVLAATIAQHERAIVRAEKAKVGRSLIKLAEDHPNPDFWRVDTPPQKRTVNPTTGLVQTGVDPLYRQRDDVFIVKDKDASGKVVERVLAFNPKNERAMELAKAMKNMDVVQLSALTESVGKVTRILANLATSWNPAFWTTNFARDVQTAAVNLQSTPLKGRAPQVIANIPRAIGGILSAEFKNGTGKWATAYRDFEAAGGKMEWGSIFNDLIDRQKQLANDIKASQRSNINPVKWGAKAFEIIEKTNSAIENATRLAAFEEARNAGMSDAKAASLAKNMTVNFRRKGTQSTGIGAWYMFFNANVQGTARMLSGLAKSRRAQAYVGAMVAFAAALELVNRMIGEKDADEDGNNTYELLGEDFLQKNMVFMIPGSKGNYASIPLAYGFNVFHNMGRMMMETVLASTDTGLVDEKKKPGEQALNFAKVLVDAFMPLGNTTTPAQFIAPSVLDPAVQYAENKNWAGYPLRPEPQSFGPATPNHKLYFRSTSDTAKDLTKWLSDLTGGDDVRGGSIDISPTTLTHIAGTAGGGTGRFGVGMFDFSRHMVERAAGTEKPEDMSWRGVPFVGKFYGEVEDRDKASKFYRLRAQAMDVWKQMETYRKLREYDKAAEVEESNPALAAMARELVAKDFKKQMSEARGQYKVIDEMPRSEREAARRDLRADETAIMSRAIRAYNEASQEQRR